MKITIGTCSNCGGAVQIHKNWLSTIPEIPSCSKCGAIAESPYGPVIKMRMKPLAIQSDI